jgi:hypothetical protein
VTVLPEGVSPLHQPALRPVDAARLPAPRPGADVTEVMVKLKTGAWQLCKVLARHQRSDRERWYLLGWGARGIWCEAWYVYDPAKFWYLDPAQAEDEGHGEDRPGG